MGELLSGLFGKKPKKPQLVTQSEPVEKVQQSNISDDLVRKRLALRRRATILNRQAESAPTIKKQKLGAGT